MNTRVNESGNYAYIPDIRAFSLGAAAAPDYTITRVQPRSSRPVADLPAAVTEILNTHGRPPQALCGVELRSPAPLTQAEFDEFNETYATMLDGLKITIDGQNPVARTNVVPTLEAPSRPVIHALSFTTPDPDGHGDYVLAGAAELGECPTLESRADAVLSQLRERQRALDVSGLPTAVDVYHRGGADGALASEIATAMGHSEIRLTLASPPLTGLEFEMDARRVSREALV